MKDMLDVVGVSCCALALSVLGGCGGGDKPPASAAKAGSHDHDHDHDHDHSHHHAGGMGHGGDESHMDDMGQKDDRDHGHGETTQMGEKQAGPYLVKVSRDGDVKAGGDVPVDVWVDGGAKGKSVRFWFGAEDGKGSVKAKCEVEDGHWHTHGEVPDPLPEASKLWIEIEGDDGSRTVVGFDLTS